MPERIQRLALRSIDTCGLASSSRRTAAASRSPCRRSPAGGPKDSRRRTTRRRPHCRRAGRDTTRPRSPAASACAQSTASAEPVVSTSTTGLPVACSASSKLALAGRQAQVRAIAAGEARIAHLHLLAFDVTGQAADEDDDVGGARHLERFVERRLGARPAPRQAHLGVANVLEVFEPAARRPCPPRRSTNDALRCARVRSPPSRQHLAVVEEQAEAVVRADDELVACPTRRQQLTGPAHAEVVPGQRIAHSAASPRATRSSVGAPRSQRNAMRESTRVSTRRAATVAAAEVLAAQALLRGSRCGTQICGIDQRRRARLLAAFDQIGAARVQALAYPDPRHHECPAGS